MPGEAMLRVENVIDEAAMESIRDQSGIEAVVEAEASPGGRAPLCVP